MTTLGMRPDVAAFDTETTATDPEEARIVSAAIVAPYDTWQWLVDPGVPIPAEATAIHGITDEQVRDGGMQPGLASVQIRDALYVAWVDGAPVVAMNAVYDLTVLDRELRRHGGHPLELRGPVLDPFVIDRALDTYRNGKRTLTALCEFYGVPLEGAHDAAVDARATVGVLWAEVTRYPQLAAMTPVQAHEAQIGWHRERQESYAAWRRSKGQPADDVFSDWPMRLGETG